eukprot:CAMPEP_0182525160 /NCGR_PEP_ID=MMETSP1323-20130603/2301_1 /TAXON_ID=236787 /ORGANISM="Florenciella parvula, Strain RCC1693" /LENGTH=38 /DNA_ID= /DNA_START= /DNA_END= /DNA_ORIENTATION=
MVSAVRVHRPHTQYSSSTADIDGRLQSPRVSRRHPTPV